MMPLGIDGAIGDYRIPLMKKHVPSTENCMPSTENTCHRRKTAYHPRKTACHPRKNTCRWCSSGSFINWWMPSFVDGTNFDNGTLYFY